MVPVRVVAAKIVSVSMTRMVMALFSAMAVVPAMALNLVQRFCHVDFQGALDLVRPSPAHEADDAGLHRIFNKKH
jgi:hypothetical protein